MISVDGGEEKPMFFFSGQLLPRSRLRLYFDVFSVERAEVTSQSPHFFDSTKLKRSAASTVLTAVGPQSLKKIEPGIHRKRSLEV